MKAINLTPHEINLANLNGEVVLTIPPSGQVARATLTNVHQGGQQIYGVPVPVFSERFSRNGPVLGLPEPEDGVLLIVSTIVRQAVKFRPDVCSPGELIRDSAGQPMACRGLVFNS